MAVLTRTWLSLMAIVCSSAASAEAADVGTSIKTVGAPPGFAELAAPRESLVDLYFGGRKVGETRITTRPGFVRFHDPGKVLALVPNARASPELVRALTGELPSNTRHVCADGTSRGCGILSPRVAGVIFDEARFRLDLFLNPEWLELSTADDDLYLSTPTAPLSLTSSMGLALSGSSGTSPAYNFQNRSIIGFRNARIRSDSSYASEFGLVVDSLVAEVDRPGFRYSAGLFWAPGLDLTGQRRILGVGVGTQFDTRADRDLIRATPLILFLAQQARVEVLVDGRLVGSGAYDAGNNVIDTSSLPNGSYSILLRVQEANGAVREERRFFVKNPQIAPVGQPLYFGYVGMLANTTPGRAISVSKDIFYQFGTARRLNESLAVDVSLIGTTKKPLFEAGAWLITRYGRMRAAGLVSASGDRGALLQVSSAQTGRLSVNFDLRRIWSRDNTPLIPLSTSVETFRPNPSPDEQFGEGSYTQISGSVGYRFGQAYLALIGSLRKDKGLPADYSIGPNLNWPIVNHGGVQVALQADAQLTRTTKAAYVGVRMLFNSGVLSMFSTGGHRAVSARNGPLARSRGVGGMTAQYSYHNEDLTDVTVAAGLERDLESTAARAAGTLYSRFGNARGEIVQTLEGDKRTQYALTLQTGAVLNRNSAIFGGRNLEESALVISIGGESGDSEFEVLINEQPRGRVKSGSRLPIFLQPYRAYKVRVRPVASASVWYETSAREITLYPGNVQHVRWQAETLYTVFGRAVRSDGSPVADAMVTSKRGLGQSDAKGYFQIEVTANESVSFRRADGGGCTVDLHTVELRGDYSPLGRVVCQ